jgi:membrane-bound lytic murein transglycosylase A
MRFVMLVPKSLDPTERARKLPLPDPRPSAEIAKLFPQTLPANDAAKNQAVAPLAAPSAVAQVSTTGSSIAPHVPLPEARPATAPVRPPRHLRRDRGIR